MEEELCMHLHKNGIEDSAFWLSQLKDFGIECKEALVNFEGDKKFFKQITAKARNEAEKKAITKLLRIDELEQKETEGAQKTLKEVEATAYDRQKLNQERIQKQTSDTQKVLQISPAFSSDNKSLDEMQKTHQELSGKLQARDSLCESEFLEKCSGGQALKGVFLRREHVEEKDFILENPGNVFVSLETCSNTKMEQFSSKDEENRYKNEVQDFCISSAISASIGYGGIAVNAGPSAGYKNTTESEQRHHTTETYSSTVKHSRVQTASITLKNEDLKLSKDAISKLKQIQDILKIHGASSAKLQEACEQFFNDYGSHASKGSLCFGGIFWWTCFSVGFHENEREALKKLQSKAISVSVGFSVAGIGASASLNIEQIKGSYQGKCSDCTLASTKLWIDAIGGPPEATDLSQWMNGLVCYNSTWRLISRGKLKPVWDIIKLNHDKELGAIKEVLRSTWENMTGLKAERDVSAILTHNPDTVLEEVSEWIKEEDKSPEQITKNLKYLLEVRRDVIKETTPTFWITEYVLQSPLQHYLQLIVGLMLEPYHVQHIKLLMEQLIEQEELKLLDRRDYRRIERVIKWLYEEPKPNQSQKPVQNKTTDFESFTKFLKTTLDDAHLQSLSTGVLEPRAASQTLAQEVSKCINHLRFYYRRTYEEVLITVLVYPFQSTCFSDVIMLKPLSLNDLETLHKRFTEQRAKFLELRRMHALNLQAYLFKLATDLCQKEQLQKLLAEMGEMIDNLQPPLRQELVTELQAYSCSSILLTLKRNLDTLMTTTPKTESKYSSNEDTLNSLKRALDTQPLPNSTLTASISLAEGDALTLLDKLGLTKYYPKRLQRMDALRIKLEPLKLSLGLESLTDPKQLPFLVLHKLMSYDSRCRLDLMPNLSEDDDRQSLDSNECESENDSSSDSQSEEEGETDTKTPDRIHPVDCLLSLFLCSDDFLRQDLYSRLAKCQLAVPFILPDPFTKELTLQLWGLRSIVKEWEYTKANSEVIKQTHPVISYEMPIVSFIRLGDHHEHISKSKILNDVISTSELSYAHFFSP